MCRHIALMGLTELLRFGEPRQHFCLILPRPSSPFLAHPKPTHCKEVYFGRSSPSEAFRARPRCVECLPRLLHGSIAPLPSPSRGSCTSFAASSRLRLYSFADAKNLEASCKVNPLMPVRPSQSVLQPEGNWSWFEGH
ncbi:unnamed protein product [Closterium sp. Yama58-4]|nr:unnamed protein product [Closterium sp. Yama58-4]